MSTVLADASHGGARPGARRRALALASLAFRTRRKTLPNSLSKAAPREVWENALAQIGKDDRVRAEVLSLDDFLALADLVPS